MVDKLRIEAYRDDRFSKKAGVFYAQVNPASYSETFAIHYRRPWGIDSAGATPALQGLTPRALTLDIVLDSTGAIPGPSKTVAKRLDEFKTIVYMFEKEMHSPKYLWLLWGTLSFYCVVKTYTVDYTLFDPTGLPLRAKIKATFTEYRSPKTIELEADKKSADLTHRRTVIDGDSLPLLCAQIYGDGKYYLQVARHNALVDFRTLRAGEDLEFPPVQMFERPGANR